MQQVAGGGGFPFPAVYIANSGGNANIASTPSGALLIKNNLFQNNWDDVVLWADSNASEAAWSSATT